MKTAFPHLTVKQQDVPSHSYDGDAPGFALFADEIDRPVFCIDQEGGTGFSYAVTATNDQALCLGQYRVGKTTLRDFYCSHLQQADFMADGSAIMVMSGPPGLDSPFLSARFLFTLPSDLTTDLEKAGPDVWGRCVLSEARFHISGGRARPVAEVDEKQAVKLLKKETFHAAPRAIPDGANLAGGSPVALLLKAQYEPTKAKNSYLKLAELAVHNAPVEDVKTQIKQVFKNDADPLNAVQGLAGIRHDDWEHFFLISLDANQEIADLAHCLKTALSAHAQEVSLPDLGGFAPNKSVGLPGVLESYAKILSDAGFDFWQMETGSDTLVFFIAASKDRKKLAKAFEATQLSHHPIEF